MNRPVFKFVTFLSACAAVLLPIASEAATTPMIYAGAQVSLAVNVDGNVFAWGTNTSGQLGNNSSVSNSATPVSVNIKNVVNLVTGLDFVIALKSDKTASAWGNNVYGQLGDGTTTLAKNPVTVKFLTGEATQFGAASASGFALLADKTLLGWGQNTSGQLGNGSTTNSSTAATAVSNLTDVTQVESGPYHVLALKADGTLWGWGSTSNGALGPGVSGTESTVPLQILSNVTTMAAGTTHNLAVKTDGSVWAWGSTKVTSYYGEAGPSSSETPTQIAGLDQIIAVSAGDYFSVALRKDGTVWTWGSNTSGQLGNGSSNSSDTPVQVSGLTGVTAISAGTTHCLALKSDGTVWAWGNNQQGQLGDGTKTTSDVPVQVVGSNSLGFLNIKTASSSSSSSSSSSTTTSNTNSTFSTPGKSPTYSCKPYTAEDYERLFRWAEGKYASTFYPPAQTATLGAYTYRYYSGTDTFLGFKSGTIYIYQPSRWSSVLSIGQTCIFLTFAEVDGY